MMAGLPIPIPVSTDLTPSFQQSTILNVLISLENNGRAKSTIESTHRILTYISKHANLNNPEQIKQFIANHQCSNAYKKNMCLAYNRYCQYYQSARARELLVSEELTPMATKRDLPHQQHNELE